MKLKMSTTYMAEIKIEMDAKAPIQDCVRNRLASYAKDIKFAAKRKQITLSHHEEATEARVAREHFELGCWLHYYSTRVGLDSDTGFKARVECAMRIFLTGMTNPNYDFFTIFDFGSRTFDAIFEMGDASEVIDRLRTAIPCDASGQLEKAFNHHGWNVHAVN
jgi:hypothetical protein